MLRASLRVTNYDVSAQATRQQMRTFVCRQCHVECYFKGPEKRLQYPWGKGLTPDSILAHHDSTGTSPGRTRSVARGRSRRRTQWGFTPDQEAARILAKSIDLTRRGQIALRGQNPPPVTNPGLEASGSRAESLSGTRLAALAAAQTAW